MYESQKPEYRRRVAEIEADAVRLLRARDVWDEADGPMVRQYAEATATAEYLSREAENFAPESQEYRRIAVARDRAQRNAGSFATKLRLTARSRPKPRAEPGPTLLGLLADARDEKVARGEWTMAREDFEKLAPERRERLIAMMRENAPARVAAAEMDAEGVSSLFPTREDMWREE